MTILEDCPTVAGRASPTLHSDCQRDFSARSAFATTATSVCVSTRASSSIPMGRTTQKRIRKPKPTYANAASPGLVS